MTHLDPSAYMTLLNELTCVGELVSINSIGHTCSLTGLPHPTLHLSAHTGLRLAPRSLTMIIPLANSMDADVTEARDNTDHNYNAMP